MSRRNTCENAKKLSEYENTIRLDLVKNQLQVLKQQVQRLEYDVSVLRRNLPSTGTPPGSAVTSVIKEDSARRNKTVSERKKTVSEKTPRPSGKNKNARANNAVQRDLAKAIKNAKEPEAPPVTHKKRTTGSLNRQANPVLRMSEGLSDGHIPRKKQRTNVAEEAHFTTQTQDQSNFVDLTEDDSVPDTVGSGPAAVFAPQKFTATVPDSVHSKPVAVPTTQLASTGQVTQEGGKPKELPGFALQPRYTTAPLIQDRPGPPATGPTGNIATDPLSEAIALNRLYIIRTQRKFFEKHKGRNNFTGTVEERDQTRQELSELFDKVKHDEYDIVLFHPKVLRSRPPLQRPLPHTPINQKFLDGRNPSGTTIRFKVPNGAIWTIKGIPKDYAPDNWEFLDCWDEV